MKISRSWSMPNKSTFKIKPIKQLLEKYVGDEIWVDPFAGWNSPAKIKNDINPKRQTEYCMDALEFLKGIPNNSVDGVLYDPPYSMRQAKECYEGFGVELLKIRPTQMNYWSECKNEIQRILKKDGVSISFGWNSQGIGKNRGFEIIEIMLIPHGGSRNDTIVTVEKKK